MALLNVGFARVTAPIDGVAGIAQAQVGDPVGPSGPLLATISTVDPIKVYFTASEQGLRPGDRVMVEGTQKVKNGLAVAPQPFVVEPITARLRRRQAIKPAADQGETGAAARGHSPAA